jgi:hypothetical protein
MGSYIEKHNVFLFLVEKLEENPIPLIDGKTPLVFDFAVETMRVETRIEWTVPKQRNALIG